jgi:histidine triad (HIT) family protein
MKYDPTNLFSKIIKGEIPCNKVYEDDRVLAFHDINPAAPVHVLVIPKSAWCSFDDFILDAEAEEVSYFFKKVRQIAQQVGLSGTGYRLIMNHGNDASQTVHHFHVHILGKKHLGPLVINDVHHI